MEAAMKYFIILTQIIRLINSINVYDCRENTTMVSRIMASEVDACPRIEEDEINTERIKIQVLQTKLMLPVTYKACKVKYTSVITYCGAHCHASMTKDGLRTVVMEIKPTECENMHRFKEYNLYGHTISALKMNGSFHSVFTPYGRIDSDSNCQGSSFTVNGINRDHAVMQITIEIGLWTGTAYFNSIDGTIQFNGGKVCKENENCWLTEKGNAHWNKPGSEDCDKYSQDILFEGFATWTKSEKTNDLGLILANNPEGVFAYQLVEEEYICTRPAYKTDHNRIKVIFENDHYGFYFKKASNQVNPKNVDLTMYLNSKITYLGKSLKNTINELYMETIYANCKQNQEILLNRLKHARAEKKTFGHIISGKLGYFNILSGEVFYIFKCNEVEVEVRRTSNCYNNLPVVYKNKSTFVEPNTRTLTNVGDKIPCSELTPPIFKVSESWFELNQKPTRIIEPKRLSPKDMKTEFELDLDNYDHLLTAGIYNRETLEEYKKFLSYPFEQEQAKQYLAESIIDTDTNGNGEYRLSRLFSDSELKEFSFSIMGHIEPHLQSLGQWGGIFFLVLAGWQIFKSLISMFVNLRILHETLGWGYHLLGATVTAITNYIVRNETPLKNKETDEDLLEVKVIKPEKDEEETVTQEKISIYPSSRSI